MECKRRILSSMFPEKMEISGKKVRTNMINEALLLLCPTNKVFLKDKKKAEVFFSLQPWEVDLSGQTPLFYSIIEYLQLYIQNPL